MSAEQMEKSALDAAVQAAHDKVTDMCTGSGRWTMSIPARPDHDHDLVIARALKMQADALTAAQEELATVSREHAALVDVVFKADERIATLQAENEKMKERLRGLGAPRDDATRFLCIKETHVWDSDLAYRTSPEITADQRRAQAELIVRCGHAKRVKYLDSALAQEAGDGR